MVKSSLTIRIRSKSCLGEKIRYIIFFLHLPRDRWKRFLCEKDCSLRNTSKNLRGPYTFFVMNAAERKKNIDGDTTRGSISLSIALVYDKRNSR